MDNDGLFCKKNKYSTTAEGEEEGKSCADHGPGPPAKLAMGKIVSMSKIPWG